MDYSLNEFGEILKKSARDFLATECPKPFVREMMKDEKGYKPELWQKMAELGWMGLAFPEKYGGGGGNFLDLCVLLDEMGRVCLPGTFFSAVILGGMTILQAGNEEQKAKLLPLISQGKTIITMAITEPESNYKPEGISLVAEKSGEGFELSGTKLFVPDANSADYIICVARTDKKSKGEKGISLFLVDTKAAGLVMTPLKTIAGDKQYEVVFNKVKVSQQDLVGELNNGWQHVKQVMLLAATGKCAEMIGGAQQVLELTVDYVKQRVQFGRPIGSFQAIQVYCVQMLTDAESSRFITYQTAWKISESLPCMQDVAMSKAWVSDAYKRITALGHQCFGAMAYMEDHDMYLYTIRAKAAEVAYGDADFNREIVVNSIGL